MDERPRVSSAVLPPSRAVALFRRLFDPMMVRAGTFAVFEIPGRITGAPRRVTLALWNVDRGLYLLSQYGVTEWVRNLRAAGRGELRRKGRSQAFTAIEVDGDERDRVIAAFNARADTRLKRDFDRLPSVVDHPAFRVEPIN
jgi:deazaflavin-dependent oxidoreductase (nitroreductase family)